MKAQPFIALAAIVLAVACAIFWLDTTLWSESPARLAPSTLDASDQAAGASVVDRPAATPQVAALPPQEPPPQAVRAEVPQNTLNAGWSVLVVDSSRRPIADAHVDLVEIRPASDVKNSRQRVRRYSSKRSGKEGIARFVPPQNAERFGVVANAAGWLRTAVPPPVALVDEPSVPLVVVLRRGSQLRGRVVDRRGRPVPNLALLALTAGYGVNHVSLSSVALRAQNRFRDPRNANYQQSRARTATDGSVAFDGVPPRAEMEVRSDDPAWRIVASETDSGDPPSVTWTAAPAFGVVVRVLDGARRPVPASARFRVDLDLADGSRQDVGQWVGKGSDSLRFSFHDELFPQLEELDVVRATFHGTVTTNAGTESWRANPILNPRRGGVAEVEVLVASSASANETLANATPTLPLVLDVVGGDGQPYADPLQVSWSSSTRAGNPQGDARAKMMSPGTYRTDVRVPGDIENLEIFVQPADASGSIAPWTTTVPAIPDRQQVLSVRLPSAGNVVILRPNRWTAAWTVRASYRKNPGDPWQGSWTYGTSNDRLTLTALRPAQWRFELVQDAPVRSETLEVSVGAGERLVVGG